MKNAFLSELTKLRRKAMYILLGLMGAVGALAVGLAVFTADGQSTLAARPGAESLTKELLSSAGGLGKATGQVGTLLGVVALAAAASIVASEYSNNTWKNLFVRQPRKMRLLVGKLSAVAAYIVVGVVIAIAVAVPTAFLAGAANDISTSAWLSSAGLASVGSTVLNTIASSLGYAAVGVVLATVLRSPVSAIGAGLAYMLPFETLLNGTLGSIGKWLPGQVFNAVAAGGSTTMVYATACAAALAYVVVAIGGSVTLFGRREL